MRGSTKLMLAGLALLAAALIWHLRPEPTITPETADAIAARVMARYVADAGDNPAHFATPASVDYPDGWDYSWVYQLCPDEGELRVFVTRGGRASITATPECNPVRGFGVRPRPV